MAHSLSELPPAITLRAVTPADRDFLLRVYASTRQEELRLVDWNAGEKAAFLQQQFEAQDTYYREHYHGASFDAIEVDGEPVGRLYVARWQDEIRIVDIALLPERRGRGIGSVLVQGLLDEAEAMGKRLSIHVEQNNPALRLYARLGFTVVGEHGIYLLMEVTPDSARSDGSRRERLRSSSSAP